MELRIFEHAEDVGEAAAAYFIEQLQKKPDSVLGLATGSSPLTTYALLIEADRKSVV